MLCITVPPIEKWDEQKEEFVVVEKAQQLCMEHSLVSLSKWESKWCKPFLSTKDKSTEEILDYIKCMTINRDPNDRVFDRLSRANVEQITDYIKAPMTATRFSQDRNAKTNKEVITSELIYYWMVALNIPFECQKWHINRLLTLIRVCNIKNQPPKKMSKRDIMSRNAALNAARRQQLNTRG